MIHSSRGEHGRNPPRRPRPAQGDVAGRAGGKRATAPDHQGIAAASFRPTGREPARGAAAARAGGGRASRGRQPGRGRRAPAGRAEAGAARRRANRGALPAHLPRIETVVDIDSTICPGCGGPCTGSARMSPSGSTLCRHSSGCWSCTGPNTPAGLARTWWCRRRHWRG